MRCCRQSTLNRVGREPAPGPVRTMPSLSVPPGGGKCVSAELGVWLYPLWPWGSVHETHTHTHALGIHARDTHTHTHTYTTRGQEEQ